MAESFQLMYLELMYYIQSLHLTVFVYNICMLISMFVYEKIRVCLYAHLCVIYIRYIYIHYVYVYNVYIDLMCIIAHERHHGYDTDFP